MQNPLEPGISFRGHTYDGDIVGDKGIVLSFRSYDVQLIFIDKRGAAYLGLFFGRLKFEGECTIELGLKIEECSGDDIPYYGFVDLPVSSRCFDSASSLLMKRSPKRELASPDISLGSIRNTFTNEGFNH